MSGLKPASSNGSSTAPSNGALDFIKDILNKSIDPNNKTYDSKIILALLYLLSMVYISEKNAMLNGYLFLIIAYVVTIYGFHKDMEYKAFFTYFENSTSIYTNEQVDGIENSQIAPVYFGNSTEINSDIADLQADGWVNLGGGFTNSRYDLDAGQIEFMDKYF